MGNYYTTLTLLEGRYATDFNDSGGNSNFPWSPTDTQIYVAESPTDPSLVTAASELINQYAGTTFTNQTTYANVVIATIDGNATTITVDTSTVHGLSIADVVTISGTTNYNGRYVVTTITDTDTFTIADTDHNEDSENTGNMTQVYVGSTGTPLNIQEACNQLTMRLVEERWIKHQLMGGSSVSDEYGAMSVFAGTFELLTPEIRLLIDESKDWAFVANTN